MSSRAAEAVSITVDIPGEPSEGIEVLGSIGTIRVDIHFPFDRLASTVCADEIGTEHHQLGLCAIPR